MNFKVSSFDLSVFRSLRKSTMEGLFSSKILIQLASDLSEELKCEKHYQELLVKFFNGSRIVEASKAIKRSPLYLSWKKNNSKLPTYSELIDHYQGKTTINIGPDNICKICYANQAKNAFVPCGHLACSNCLFILEQNPDYEPLPQTMQNLSEACWSLGFPIPSCIFMCPFCRSPVNATLPIYP